MHVLIAFSVSLLIQTVTETLNVKLSNRCETVCLTTVNKYGAGELFRIFYILHLHSV